MRLGDDLRRFLDATRAYPDAISGAVLVAREGGILVAEGYGVADVDTGRAIDRSSLWDVASISKQFTAAGMLVLQQDGLLSIDDPLAKFFPAVPEDKAAVTVRQLLNHTSGIANSYDHGKVSKTVDFQRKESAISFYLGLPMSAVPGEAWAYSNLAYNLLAAIIEKVTGDTWEVFVRDRVLRPAGMKESWPLGDPDLPRARVPRGFRGTRAAFPYGEVSHWAGYRGAGGVHTTLDDLLLWDRALRTDRLLTAASREQMFTPGLRDYALGWRIDRDASGHRRASHGGAVPGFVTHIIRGLDEDLVVAVLTNDYSARGATEIAEILWSMVQAGHVIVFSDPSGKEDDDIGRFAGRYIAEPGCWVDVKAREGILDVVFHDWPAAAAILRQNGRIVDVGATVEALLPVALESLAAGGRRHVASGVEAASLAAWRRSLAGVRDPEPIGYFFPKTGHVEQFATIRMGDRSVVARFHWFSGALTEVEVAPDAFATFTFAPAGTNVFRHGTADSWRAALLEISGDGLRLNGSPRLFRRS